jgi:hypothetical protein
LSLDRRPKPKLPGEDSGPKQGGLFGDEPTAAPAAPAGDEPAKVIYVHFETWEDYDRFQELIQRKLATDTRSIRFPLERKEAA